MRKIVKMLLKFEKTSIVKKIESDLSDARVKFIHVQNEYSDLNYLNLYYIKCDGENFFNDNYEKIDNDIAIFIIKNIQNIIDYRLDLIDEKIIYEYNGYVYINKSKCVDYLRFNNRLVRWSNKYDKTYYKFIIYILGIMTSYIIKMITMLL